jgi:hypothetical protein
VAGIAVSESLHEVPAAIPFIALYRVRLINTLCKIKGAPEVQERAEVKRKIDLVWGIALLDRGQGLQVSENSISILTGHLGVIGIRKRGV